MSNITTTPHSLNKELSSEFNALLGSESPAGGAIYRHDPDSPKNCQEAKQQELRDAHIRK